DKLYHFFQSLFRRLFRCVYILRLVCLLKGIVNPQPATCISRCRFIYIIILFRWIDHTLNLQQIHDNSYATPASLISMIRICSDVLPLYSFSSSVYTTSKGPLATIGNLSAMPKPMPSIVLPACWCTTMRRC